MNFKLGRPLFILTLIWLVLILTLGAWWLYLIVQISGDLENALAANGTIQSQLDYLKLAKWEGGAFVFLVVSLTLVIIYLYQRDLKKNYSLSAFFASLTHELKTPLASIRLQAEVIKETFDHKKSEMEQNNELSLNANFISSFERLTQRLIEDSQRLENELDNLLQLSRIERGGLIKLKEIQLSTLFKEQTRKWSDKFELVFSGNSDILVLGDEFSFNLIFRNLISNSIKHANKNRAHIEIKTQEDIVSIIYSDRTSLPNVDESKLGTLFYKEPTSKGTGVGLYLVKRLSQLMEGSFEIRKNFEDQLEFEIKIQKASVM